MFEGVLLYTRSTDLLVLDTPPKHPPPAAVSFPSSGKGHPLHNFASPKGFSTGDMAAMVSEYVPAEYAIAELVYYKPEARIYRK